MEDIKGIEHYTLNQLRNHQLSLGLIKESIDNFYGLPDDLKSNEEFMFEACQINGQCLLLGNPKFLHKEYICKQAIIQNPEIFPKIPNKTKELCLLALEDTKNWEHIPIDLKNNIPFIKKVAKINFNYYFKIFPKQLKNRGVVKSFLNSNGLLLKWMDLFIQNDKELATISLKNSNYNSFDYMSSALKNDAEFLFDILPENPDNISYCGNDIKSNPDIALALFSKDKEQTIQLLYYFSDDIKNNEIISFQAILRNSLNMKYVSNELKNDINFIEKYSKHHLFNANSLEFISDDLKKNSSLMKQCFIKDKNTLKYIDKSLKNDADFLNFIFKDINLYQNTYKDIFNSLQIQHGDERAVLYFINALYPTPEEKEELYKPENFKDKIRTEIFYDNKFYFYLMEHPNPYLYLTTTELEKKLKEELPSKEKKVSKKI